MPRDQEPAMRTEPTAGRRDDLTTARDGVPIATYTWLPAGSRPRARVRLVHGAAEHARRQDRLARLLAGHGFGVVATDHRGHGPDRPADRRLRRGGGLRLAGGGR